jgi:hypothetical protein
LAHIFTSLILGSFFGILNEILNKIKWINYQKIE